MNFRTFDLNLLRVFDALMQERNGTRASSRLALSQPAVSHALGRLRHQLGDALFVRSADGLRPTPRALEIAQPVRQALAEIERTLDPGFDVGAATREFRIVANDYATATVLPALVRHLREHAPHTSLRLQTAGAETFAALDEGDADLALAGFLEVPERFAVSVLIQDDYVCLMRRDHPLAGAAALDAARFAQAEHLLVSPAGDARGFADRLLAAQGLARRVVVTVNQFSVVPAVLVASDLVCTYPKLLAERALHEHANALVMRPFPLRAPIEAAQLQMLWHRRLGQHAALVWLRDSCISVAAAIRGGEVATVRTRAAVSAARRADSPPRSPPAAPPSSPPVRSTAKRSSRRR